MNTEEKLKELWNSIDYYNGGSLKLNIHHPLEWHVAFVSESQKAIVIISNELPQGIETSKSILIQIIKRLDGRYATSMILTEKNQEQVFISMCANLIDYSESALSEKDSLKRVVFRFRQWQRLMAYKRIALMSQEARKGLIGELFYLKKVIHRGKDIHIAVDGWVGPNGEDQDFVYSDGWHEIKTTGVSSEEVKISSVEQLGDNDSEGELVIERVDKCAPETKDAFSLNDIVSDLLVILKADDGVVDNFISKLNCIGYISLPEYDKDKYKYSGEEIYTIKNGFPRITREDLRSEITNCKYNLSIAAISEWKKME